MVCISKLIADAEVHVVRWPVNAEAPFLFDFSNKLKIYNRRDFTGRELVELVTALNPEFIYCSGWMDKAYLRVCKQFNGKIPVMVGFDNHWKGTLKQKLAVLLSSFTIQTTFSHCWIPGLPQYEYALKLGFKDQEIVKGLYSADVDFFHKQYIQYRDQKQRH